MKRLSLPVVLLVSLLFGSCSKENIEQVNADEVSIKPSPGARMSASAKDYFVELNGKDDFKTVSEKLAAAGITNINHIPELGIVYFNEPNQNKVTASGVIATEALEMATVDPNTKPENMIARESLDALANAGATNTFFHYLWAMRVIKAPAVWSQGYTGKDVKVAVIDGGIYATHPDLAANLLVDRGRNFVNLGPSCTECNPMDPTFKYFPARGIFSHSTHVSGTIAALDNNIGVIGVAPQAKIIPIKALADESGSGAVTWIAAAIVYAANEGAQVINLSLGGLRLKGLGQGSNQVQAGIKLYNQAIQYATGKGVVVVCAAGNNGLNLNDPKALDGTNGSLMYMPANSPHAIAVSATAPYDYWYAAPYTGSFDNLTSYSNYGSYVDVAAPGGDFWAGYYDDGILSTGSATGYYWSIGTSMATPHVAGLAALVIGKYDGSLSPTQVKRIIKNSADAVGKNGNDIRFGAGRINAEAALK